MKNRPASTSSRTSSSPSTSALSTSTKILLGAGLALCALIGIPWLLESNSGETTTAPTSQTSGTTKESNSRKSNGTRNSSNALANLLGPSTSLPVPDTTNADAEARLKAAAAAAKSSAFLSMQSQAGSSSNPGAGEDTGTGAGTDTDFTSSDPDNTEPAFHRPITAPNGTPWPEESDYIDGYDQQATGGLCSVTIDNTRNADDVFLKLVALSGSTINFQPVRYCYIRAFSQFTFVEVQPGYYDVRFQNLTTGEINASQPFTLRETTTPQGVRYSTYSLTLYGVANGNTRLKPLKENQF